MAIPVLITAALSVASPGNGPAEAASAPIVETDCYDIAIVGEVVRQIYSPIPETDESVIIIRWPWFIDIRASDGSIVSTLALVHSYYRHDLGVQNWYLRRNSVGGFNLFDTANGAASSPRQCDRDAPPATAYIQTSAEELRALREAAEIAQSGG